MQPNYATADGFVAGTRNFGDNAMVYVQEWGLASLRRPSFY